jgi:hypothetical protein
MTTVQILAVSTPVIAFLFMGLIALIERRYDRAPAVTPRNEISAPPKFLNVD